MKRLIRASADRNYYLLDVTLAGQSILTEPVEGYGRDLASAGQDVLEDIQNDLRILNTEDLGNGRFAVTIGFDEDGTIFVPGISKTYKIRTDSLQDAETEAIYNVIHQLHAKRWRR